jgi:Mg-chelatase subunit ChlD
MLCEIIADLVPKGAGGLTCPGAPAWAATVLAGVASLLAAAALALGGRGAWLRRAAAAVAFMLAALLLAVAAARPAWVPSAEAAGPGGTIVVLIDQSRSLWREPASAGAALQSLSTIANGIPAQQGWTAQVLGFGGSSTIIADLPDLTGLAAAVLRAAPVAPADDSDLAGALAAAGEAIADRGGRGLILALTDGLATAPDEALLRSLISRGIAVHVLAVGSSYPDTGLVSADVGPMQNVGVPAIVRGTTLGPGRLKVSASAGTVEQDRDAGEVLIPLRAEIAFAARGLEPVDLSFGAGQRLQTRTLYTMVKGPARVLAYGEAAWLDVLDPARWQIRRAEPRAPVAPEGYDLVVIDALAPADFAAGYADHLLAAASGTGILIANGPQRGDKTEKQVITLWNETALSPILPVDTDPRAFVQSPPPRDVVIMIDTSLSMILDRNDDLDPARFNSAKSATSRIIAELQPQDTIWIIPFTDEAGPDFPRQDATPEVIAAAQRYVASLEAGGGTNPNVALEKSASVRSNQCAFFLISDGGFKDDVLAPQCFTVGIGVDGFDMPPGKDFWGQSIVLNAGETADRLRFDYFEPEIREDFFRPGRFDPLLAAGAEWLPQPAAMEGVAISYPRSDSGVELLAVHSGQPRDPAIATRRDPERPMVSTGVILGDVGGWRSPAGATVDALMTRLTGWNDPDRYDIRIGVDGQRLKVQITVLSSGDRPIPQTLSASILLADGQPVGLGLGPGGEAGVFQGQADFPPESAGQRALLVVAEQEGEQRIPIRLPRSPEAGTGADLEEAFDFGVDTAMLARLARETGGAMPASVPVLSTAAGQVRYLPLSAWFIAAAALAFAAAFWARGQRA